MKFIEVSKTIIEKQAYTLPQLDAVLEDLAKQTAYYTELKAKLDKSSASMSVDEVSVMPK